MGIGNGRGRHRDFGARKGASCDHAAASEQRAVTLSALAANLTLGCRILAEQDILDAYGHLSARVPGKPEHFMISRAMSPALVESTDFIVLDLNGTVVEGTAQPNAEWPIHASIYQARSGVLSVLHSHSRLSQIFSLSQRKLQGLLMHNAPEWQKGVPVYRAAGLITTRERGDALARVLAESSAMLLRGHGDVVATDSVRNTVLQAIALKQNADVLHALMSHGGDIDLWNPDELDVWNATLKSIPPAIQVAVASRVWDYHEARVNGRLLRLLNGELHSQS